MADIYKSPVDGIQHHSDPAAPANQASFIPGLIFAASVAFPYASKSANYTLTDADFAVEFDCTSAGRTATLPTAVGATGRTYLIRKKDSSANVVTINTTSSQTVNGAASGAKTITAQYGALLLISDGANWMAWTLTGA